MRLILRQETATTSVKMVFVEQKNTATCVKALKSHCILLRYRNHRNAVSYLRPVFSNVDDRLKKCFCYIFERSILKLKMESDLV